VRVSYELWQARVRYGETWCTMARNGGVRARASEGGREGASERGSEGGREGGSRRRAEA